MNSLLKSKKTKQRKSPNPRRRADYMKEYIEKRIAELEEQKAKLIEAANQCMSDASAVNGGILELQQMLEKIKTEGAE
jgi:adenylate kinase family enzyme